FRSPAVRASLSRLIRATAKSGIRQSFGESHPRAYDRRRRSTCDRLRASLLVEFFDNLAEQLESGLQIFNGGRGRAARDQRLVVNHRDHPAALAGCAASGGAKDAASSGRDAATASRWRASAR